MLVLDDQFRLVDSNPKALKIFGWNKTPVGMPVDHLEFDLIDKSYILTLNSDYCFEKRIIQNNHPTDFEITASVLRNKQYFTVGYLFVMHDISHRKKVEHELQELSLVDELTALKNRRGFLVLSEQLFSFCLRMKMNAVLFFIDMDNLKHINDQFGHATGDQAIIDVACILKKSFRSSDIIARFGGDEFVVLAIETAENSKSTMLHRLKEQHLITTSEVEQKYELNFSTGTSIFEWKNPLPMETLLKDADLDMYAEKQSKKGE